MLLFAHVCPPSLDPERFATLPVKELRWHRLHCGSMSLDTSCCLFDVVHERCEYPHFGWRIHDVRFKNQG
jgi:hypothetical protein